MYQQDRYDLTIRMLALLAIRKKFTIWKSNYLVIFYHLLQVTL